MEEKLHKLRNWISHGSMQQFFTEVSPKLLALGYETDLVGGKLSIFRVEKQGGFLGIGAKKVRTAVLETTRQGDDIEIDSTTVDPAIVDVILGFMHAH